ncbi:MAG: sulfurtransferase [Trueperaceae bacterium]|nr:MAG: sulfurtransferase [Trueperaceae bacterium]
MSNLIRPQDLYTELTSPSLRIVDTRFDLQDPKAGRQAYREAHLPGAIYFDLDEDLSTPPGRHGGRHPLPDMEAFAVRLGQAGIGNDSSVVVYDDSGGMFAGRFWWMLRYLGHGKVKLLDGGFTAWQAAGFEVTGEIPTFDSTEFKASVQAEMMVDREYVMRRLDDPGLLLIDARAAERYRGEVEPIDSQAGHIPSAINLPFAGNLREGRFKPAEELRKRYAVTEEVEEVVLYCGSGVSAAHNLIALEEAGIRGAKLYLGSWSDWCSFRDAPIATGEDG